MKTTLQFSLFASCFQVFGLTLRRQFFSRQTIVITVLLGLSLAITIVWLASDSYVRAPMRGTTTFYRALSPETNTYYVVGDRVEAESVVCFVQGRRGGKRELKARVSGVISEIIIENDFKVSRRETLVRIQPDRTGLQLAGKILQPLFMGFLLPIISLGYASAAISGERTSQTLVYLLSTSIPRSLIYFSIYLAILLLTLAVTLSCLAALCLIIGTAGFDVCYKYTPVVFLATTCYASLFLLFSALVRRATFLALAYALMVETLTANMPGVVKSITVSFYANSWLYDKSLSLGLEPSIPAYDPVGAVSSQIILVLASLAFLLLGMWIFSRKEYD